jgi:hypothetical protein
MSANLTGMRPLRGMENLVTPLRPFIKHAKIQRWAGELFTIIARNTMTSSAEKKAFELAVAWCMQPGREQQSGDLVRRAAQLIVWCEMNPTANTADMRTMDDMDTRWLKKLRAYLEASGP